MAKKKNIVQLLPFDYLVKIGRIKKNGKNNGDLIGNKGVWIPESMIKDLKDMEGVFMKKDPYPPYTQGTTGMPQGWTIQTNWLKP